MSLVRLYARVLGLLGSDRRLAWALAGANVMLAVAAFAEPLLMGRIIDQLTQQTVDCLLEAAFAEDPAFDGHDGAGLARHVLTRAGLSQHNGEVQIALRLGVPVIGLGASAPSYYGAVGAALGCEMILPQHAGVANAIGAVVGQISQRASATITSPSEGRYTVHLAKGLQHFNSKEVALAAVEAALTQDASRRAQAAGAADVRISVTHDIREAAVEGRAMFVEARISVTASGRPRVAHAPNPA